jgi:hypothetical protein
MKREVPQCLRSSKSTKKWRRGWGSVPTPPIRVMHASALLDILIVQTPIAQNKMVSRYDGAKTSMNQALSGYRNPVEVGREWPSWNPSCAQFSCTFHNDRNISVELALNSIHLCRAMGWNFLWSRDMVVTTVCIVDAEPTQFHQLMWVFLSHVMASQMPPTPESRSS